MQIPTKCGTMLKGNSRCFQWHNIHYHNAFLQQEKINVANTNFLVSTTGCTTFIRALLYQMQAEKKALESAAHSITFHTCAALLHKRAPRLPPQGDLGAHLEALTSLPAGFIAKAICDDWRSRVVMDSSCFFVGKEGGLMDDNTISIRLIPPLSGRLWPRNYHRNKC